MFLCNLDGQDKSHKENIYKAWNKISVNLKLKLIILW